MEIFVNLQYKQTQYSKSKNPNIKTIDTIAMCDYYDRDEACDKSYEPDEVNTDKAVNYYKYRLGSNGGWGKNGDFKNDEDKKMFEKYQPETIYRMVVSFDESFAEENMILSKKAMKNLMNKSMDKNIRELGLDPDNCEYGCYYHTNTNHPHIHAFIFEKDATRKDYHIKQKAFKKIKSNIIRNMNINSQMYIKRDNAKKELLDNLENLGISFNKLDYSNNSKKLFQNDKNLKKLFKELEKKLPVTGSLKYNSANMLPYRQEIDLIVNLILSKEELKPLYDKYKELLAKEKEMFDNRYYSFDESKDKNKSLENKDKELRDRIANLVLQNVKYYREDVKQYKNEKPRSSSNNTTKSFTKKCNNSINYRSNSFVPASLDEISKAINNACYEIKVQQKMLDNVIAKARQEIYSLGG